MRGRPSLGLQFGWLWAAYAVSAYGSEARVRRLPADRDPGAARLGLAEVAVLSASGLAIGAAIAVPLGPWAEFRAQAAHHGGRWT